MYCSIIASLSYKLSSLSQIPVKYYTWATKLNLGNQLDPCHKNYLNKTLNSSMRRWAWSALESCTPRVMFASSILRFWTSSNRASIVFSMISLIVVTGLVCPSRCYAGR